MKKYNELKKEIKKSEEKKVRIVELDKENQNLK